MVHVSYSGLSASVKSVGTLRTRVAAWTGSL